MSFHAMEYIKGVLDSSIVTGRYQRLAIERHVKDLEDKALPYTFDKDAAQKACGFFSKYLHHSKGQWAGQKFELLPWQIFVTWSLFGWVDGLGFRRFRTAFLEMGRKQGKSTYASGIGNLLLFGDNEPGAEIYSLATKLDQSRIVHEEAVRMVRSSPELFQFARILHNKITVPRINGSYLPLGADSTTLDGLNMSGGIADETHAWPSRELWDVAITATSARRQPLILAISTAGYDKEAFGYTLRQYAIGVLEGSIDDERFFAFVCTLDPEDDWKDSKAWVKANPSLGVTIQMDELKDQFQVARSQPSFENSFKRYRLNQWTEQETIWLPVEKWDSCKGPLDVTIPKQKTQYEKALEGRECYVGLDLSKTTDLTALVLIFPETDGELTILPFFFIPRDTMNERIRLENIHYASWERQGFIIPTQGDQVDYSTVLDVVKQCALKYTIKQFCFDAYNATKFIQDLEKDLPDLECVAISQAIKQITIAVTEAERLILDQKLVHGGNPILRWNFTNLMMISDINENKKPSKKKSSGRIDGISAMLTGLSRYVLEPAAFVSAYTERLHEKQAMEKELEELMAKDKPTDEDKERINELRYKIDKHQIVFTF